MSANLQNNVFSKINQIEERLNQIEERLERMDGASAKAFKVLQSQMVRIKNGERLSDDFVLNRRRYNDLSPEKAYELYQERDRDFIFLDVSSKSHSPQKEIPEAVNIPLEELGLRCKELVNKAASVFVMSEDGTKSILACEILNKHGFFNVNNISGGYKFWPGFRNWNERKKAEGEKPEALNDLKSA